MTRTLTTTRAIVLALEALLATSCVRFVTGPPAADRAPVERRAAAPDRTAHDLRSDRSPPRDRARDLPAAASKRVFVTSQLYPCNLGGLAGADAKCRERAEAAGLSGVYRAWLSDSKNTAASRLTHSSNPYRLVDGKLVASGWTDLIDGKLDAPIDKTESGKSPPASYVACSFNTLVWSSTAASGEYPMPSFVGNPSLFGNDWQSTGGSDNASFGRWDQVGPAWSHSCQLGGCSLATAPLYCFEQ